IDRRDAVRLARGGALSVGPIRNEARDAIKAFLIRVMLIVGLAGLALGTLVALAVEHGRRQRLTGIGVAAGTAVVLMVALGLTLPPNSSIGDPEYYAHGPDIPRALQAISNASRSSRTLSEEVDAQLVGLARFVSDPAGRPETAGLPRLAIASDLHNNVLALPGLRQAAAGLPLLFDGDLTDRGSPLEIELAERVVHAGHPLVFVSGNHDSDTSVRRLARAGAIVLTQRGRLLPSGRYGPMVVRVGGVRIAGYADPFQRRRSLDYAAADDPHPTDLERRAFADWLRGIRDRVDIVMVHEPGLAVDALEEMHRDPPGHDLLVVLGHTHRQDFLHERTLTVINAGTAGGGGTGNLAESAPIGVGLVTYRRIPDFRPVAVDLVEIDPGSGSARAVRHRID
ncbi:MAG TPA: metallophosphoesterase, partial [Solirubrobacteraceae bacterium]|nr:metallophosphoesterase [Solirubrobacteraceae bacterium]